MKRILAAWFLLALVALTLSGWQHADTSPGQDLQRLSLDQPAEALLPGLPPILLIEKGAFSGDKQVPFLLLPHLLLQGAALAVGGSCAHPDQYTYWKADTVALLCPAHEFT